MDTLEQKPKKKISKRALKLINHLEVPGISSVAEKTGILASRIYNWKYGVNPTFDALESIADNFDGIDWNDIFYENKKGQLKSTYVSESESEKRIKELEQKLEEANKIIEDKNQTIEELKEDKRAYRQMIAMYPDKESFPKAVEEALGLQVFVDETMNRTDRKLIGFRQKQAAQSTAKNAV